MATLRYSGELRIRITYLEPYVAGDKCPSNRSTRLNGEYRCYITTPADGAGETIYVGAPAILSRGVDSPEAFDEAAAASLSFAHHQGWPVEEHAAYDAEASDWHIGRSKDQAFPKEKASV